MSERQKWPLLIDPFTHKPVHCFTIKDGGIDG
jgi:hypothetical protein